MINEVDVTFDFRSDTPSGKDPDLFSNRLRQHHKALWSKPLPSGVALSLDDSKRVSKSYLNHSSALGNFEFSSDTVIPTFTRWKRMQSIVSQISEEESEAFRSCVYTIGGMMLWPRRSEGGLKSINVMRGFHSQIADRMDLTLECVRRHYAGLPHPLQNVLNANAGFFTLFRDFEGFVSHFLLQDLVDSQTGQVRFFMHFDDFSGPSRPMDIQTYLIYREKSIDFVNERNARIERYVKVNG